MHITQQSRDSGNDFLRAEIGSDNSRFSFILFLYLHVVPSCFSVKLSNSFEVTDWVGGSTKFVSLRKESK